jgi:hypothetical protein
VTCPAALAIRGCVIACPLANGMFDAAVAFGVLFHLTQPEQVAGQQLLLGRETAWCRLIRSRSREEIAR